MPIIRHRTGPLAGQEQAIPEGAERIVFGRDPSACDVVYPADLILVARRHFALVRKPSREWVVEEFGKPFVAVDGEPATEGQAVASGAVVELGRIGGPSFAFVAAGKDLDTALLATGTQQERPSPYALGRRNRRLALAGIAVAGLAVAGAGASSWLGWQETEQLRRTVQVRLDAANLKYQEAQEQFARSTISREHSDRLAAAAYHVVLRDEAGGEFAAGTAAPIAPSLLATNAHVAELREKLRPDQRMYVRAPAPDGRAFEVVAHRVHPAYAAVSWFVEQDPFFVHTLKDSDKDWGLGYANVSPNGYDVALLQVSETLSPVLEIADRAELEALVPGDPIAYAGYPTEGVSSSHMQAFGPVPQQRAGTVTAVTDLFSMPSDPAHSRLIHHNMAITGGASGSPIIGRSGRIVALVNSGEVVGGAGGRRIFPGLINYGQRADYLLELLSGDAEKNLDRERAYWAKQTASLQRGFDAIIPHLIERESPQAGAKPVPVVRLTLRFRDGDPVKAVENGKEITRRRVYHAVTLEPGVKNTFIVYAEQNAIVRVQLEGQSGTIARDDENSMYGVVSHRLAGDKAQAQLVVTGPDKDIGFQVLHYTWSVPRS